jgi:hypothetical protein
MARQEKTVTASAQKGLMLELFMFMLI